MFDFTFNTYKILIKTFKEENYKFLTFGEYIINPKNKAIILRHDVDAIPGNSLTFAKYQHEHGISGTYFFRIVKKSFDSEIILQISDLGHEIGYHYEDLALEKGDIDSAYDSFRKNLEILRKYYPIETICMHGSPLSPWDSREIWQKYDYKNLGIIGEPYLDLDYSKVLYLTDTGRRWDGRQVSVRDKILENSLDRMYSYCTTEDIINGLRNKQLPNQIMINFHPQRWTNNPVQWLTEIISQSLKNRIKKIFFVNKNNK